MLPVPTKNATHSYGPPPNWNEETMGKCGHLSVRAQEGKGGVLESVSTWKPTLEEINYLQEGGSVILTVCGKQPAVSLHVELDWETPEAALEEPREFPDIDLGEPHGDVGDRKP